MKNLTFTGIDGDLEISLFEYGLLLSIQEHEDGSGTHFVVYRMWGYNNDDAFGTGHISEKEIDGYVQGKEFMDDQDIVEFLQYLGIKDPVEWFDLPMVSKLYDLISYWGYENIMGTDYYPWTEEFVRREILKEIEDEA